MRGKRPTISIYFDKRRIKKNGKYPVKLILTATWLRPRQKSFPLNIDLTADEWRRIQGNPKGKLNQVKKQIEQEKADAYNVVNQLLVYTHSAFENKFIGGDFYTKQVYDVFESKIKDLIGGSKISTADGYKGVLSAIRTYRNSKPLYFIDVDVAFLKGFLNYLEVSKKKGATIRTYFRYFQHIFNIAIEEKLVPKDHYPFNSKSIKLPSGAQINRALPRKSILKIKAYSSSEAKRQFARDIWFFSYCVGGINFTDIAYLTIDNLRPSENAIIFDRGKTSEKKHSSKPIVIPLNSEASEIVAKYADHYLFPILIPGISSSTAHHRIKGKRRRLNKALALVCAELEIPVTTFASARHSFATEMKRMGVSLSEIGLKMGHAEDSKMSGRYIKQDADQYRSVFERLI